MERKTVAKVSGAIFAIIAVLHLLRAILGWQASIAGWDVPVWLSILPVVFMGWLAWENWKAGR